MTDQEILDEYKNTIEKNISLLFKEHNIEDDIKKEYFANRYRKRFIEGFKKGYEEEKMNMARKMLAKGMSIQDTSELTGLTVEVIQDL